MIIADKFGKRASDGLCLRTMRKRALNLRSADAASASKVGMLTGYAAVFNVPSYDLGWGDREVYEIIAPGAFSKSLRDPGLDVRCLVDHETSAILGRTLAKTLSLREDSTGLYFECDLPDTTAGRDTAVSVGRGDLTDMSFGFNIVGESWDYRDGVTIRTLTEVEIMEISPVCFSAYPNTTIQLRSFDQAKRLIVPPVIGLDPDRARRLRLVEAEATL